MDWRNLANRIGAVHALVPRWPGRWARNLRPKVPAGNTSLMERHGTAARSVAFASSANRTVCWFAADCLLGHKTQLDVARSQHATCGDSSGSGNGDVRILLFIRNYVLVDMISDICPSSSPIIRGILQHRPTAVLPPRYTYCSCSSLL